MDINETNKDVASLDTPMSKLLQIKYKRAKQGQLAGGHSAAVNRILRRLRSEVPPKPEEKQDEADDMFMFERLG